MAATNLTSVKSPLLFRQSSAPTRPTEIVNSLVTLHKGDEVKFSIMMKNGKKNAVQVSCIPSGTVKIPTSEIDSNPCQGKYLFVSFIN